MPSEAEATAYSQKTVAPDGGQKLVLPEDEMDGLFDSCATDALVKGTTGTLIGALMSVCFFKRRAFPIFMGLGFGLGSAYQSCEKRMKLLTTNSTQQM